MSHGVVGRTLEDNDSIVSVVSGTLYAMEPLSRMTQYRLNRRHLESIDDSPANKQMVRLDLGPDMVALDMELSQDTAWTEDSLVVVRRGEKAEELHDIVNRGCYLSGLLTSQAGAVTLNRCGRMVGMIQTGDHHYEIKEEDDAPEGRQRRESNDSDSDLFADVKVIVRRSEGNMTTPEGGVILNEEGLGYEEYGEDILNGTDAETSPTKRQRNKKPIAAEVAAFLDSNFSKYMSKKRGKKTVQALTDWVVMKWNIIRQVYGNANKIGVPFALLLKKVEVWWNNPNFYRKLNSKHDTSDFLRSFCKNTANSPNYDHKMLYTKETGGHHLGMAYLNGICRTNIKCSLVKAFKDEVKIELHEFGHNVGLEHDPGLEPCTDPAGDGGFMGWAWNYKILDCYKRDLLKHIKEPGAKCLYQDNVGNLETLNPTKEESKNGNNNKQNENNNNGGKC